MDKHSEYGRIYSEICRGFSIEVIEDFTVYFKHPTIAENFSIYNYYDFFIKTGRKKGLELEKEKIENAIKGGWWSSHKESQVDLLNKTIKNLIKTRNKLILPSQKTEIDKQIKYNEAILITYTKERREIVGYTLEDYANNRLTEELLLFFTYKNKDFTEKLFPDREYYYDLNDRLLNKIKNSFNLYSNIFNINNIKKIAASGFFQNLVYLNDDAYSFWGKPATECTKYQIDTLLYGKMYRHTIKSYAENGKPIQDEILNDPDNFVEWVDNQNNSSGFKTRSNKSKSGGSNMVSSYVGATKEDLNHLGVKTEKLKGKTLLELANEKGGVLEKNDYLSARENN